MATSKIQPRHRDRLAVVYVRQSTPQQVLLHAESAALQYDLVRRAVALGWSRSRVLVIDEDQGRSGQSVEGRLGFQRLLAEVGLDHVGLILGLEMSRLARSCKDWHQLLELCAHFGTILADQDGLYDPTDYNDRLLLGLKGTMSEAELHILRNRLNQGRLNKARRGELITRAPVGYVRLPTGEVTLDPDEQVREVVRMIFDKFDELRSIGGVLRYLARKGVHIGLRQQSGPGRGELRWRCVTRRIIWDMLHHPLYAGAYSYGRRVVDPRRRAAGRSTALRLVPPGEYAVLLRDRFPAYITWMLQP
jgi:DNA invertase Pin-like site-specific DNA recombinase